MVLFDQLRISDDGTKMYINIHVNEATQFNDSLNQYDVYLDKMYICTDKGVNETAFCDPEQYEPIYEWEAKENLKEATFIIKTSGPDGFNENFSGATMSNNLFFVFVKCKGTPDPCVPCRLDEEWTLGVTFDVNLLYQKVMQYTRELNDDCEIPKGFIDLVMLWNGFKAAVDTEHYQVAIDFWKRMFFGGSHGMATNRTRPCGCGG